MSDITTVQSIIKTFGILKPAKLVNINAGNLRYLKEDVCEFSGVRQLAKPKKFFDRLLIKKFGNETLSDFGGRRPRFCKDEVDGLLDLCKSDKNLVVKLVEQKSPHYLRGYPDEGRFNFKDIKEFVEFSSTDKAFLLDLVNAKTAKNKSTFGTSHIKNLLKLFKLDQNTAKKIADESISERVVENLIELSKTNPVNYRDIIETGVFDLIKKGKVKVELLGDIGSNKFLSKNVLTDLKKMRDNKPVVSVLPKEVSIDNISKYVKNGEVCTQNSIVYVNDNGNPVKLNMTKEKFEELFPLLKSSYMNQGNIGDCWLISFLDSIMSKPKGKVAIYNSISQDGKDIIVKFNSSKKSIRFKNGELHPDNDQIMQSAQGLQFIEQAFAIHRHNNYTKGVLETDALKVLSSEKNILDQLEEGVVGEAYDAIINKISTKKFIKEVFTTVRDSVTGRDKPRYLIKKYANDENCALQFYMIDKTSPSKYRRLEACLDTEYGLISEHGYTIKGFDEVKGNVYISNPHNTEIITEMPLEKLLEYVKAVIPLKLNV